MQAGEVIHKKAGVWLMWAGGGPVEGHFSASHPVSDTPEELLSRAWNI